jgi:hypothetical protein
MSAAGPGRLRGRRSRWPGSLLRPVCRTVPPGGAVRPALEAAARDQWPIYQRHRWMLQVSGSRAGLGPNELAAYEAQVRLVDGLGPSGIDMTRIISLLRR